MKQQYAVNTCFSFSGLFFVNAENEEEAREIVKEQCGFVMGGNIHSTLSDKDVTWYFPMHPVKKVGRIRFKEKFDKANRRD